MQNELDIKALDTNSILAKLEEQLLKAKDQLKMLGPTNCLWLQYIKMIDILKSSIRSDRIGMVSNTAN